jgi:hypothetical protein
MVVFIPKSFCGRGWGHFSVVPPSRPFLLGRHASPRKGDMERLCYLLRRPTNYGCQVKEQCLLTDVTPSPLYRRCECGLELPF